MVWFCCGAAGFIYQGYLQSAIHDTIRIGRQEFLLVMYIPIVRENSLIYMQIYLSGKKMRKEEEKKDVWSSSSYQSAVRCDVRRLK
jgi:hypothetical protein